MLSRAQRAFTSLHFVSVGFKMPHEVEATVYRLLPRTCTCFARFFDFFFFVIHCHGMKITRQMDTDSRKRDGIVRARTKKKMSYGYWFGWDRRWWRKKHTHFSVNCLSGFIFCSQRLLPSVCSSSGPVIFYEWNKCNSFFDFFSPSLLLCTADDYDDIRWCELRVRYAHHHHSMLGSRVLYASVAVT